MSAQKVTPLEAQLEQMAEVVSAWGGHEVHLRGNAATGDLLLRLPESRHTSRVVKLGDGRDAFIMERVTVPYMGVLFVAEWPRELTAEDLRARGIRPQLKPVP